MNRPRKIPDLPSVARPKWTATDRRSDLQYLGWGLRSYGRHPTMPQDDETWSYSVIVRGTPTILLRDGPHRLAARQAIIVAPPRPYAFGFSDERDAMAGVLIWVWRTQPLLPQVRPQPEGHLLVPLDAGALGRLQTIHKACRREVAHVDPFTARVLGALRLQLDSELARRLGGHDARADRRVLLDMAVLWMQEHPGHANPVFLLCDYLQVARSTLDDLFRDAFGESPSAHFRRLRMQRAQDLLDHGRSVKEVAFQLGYKHANDFSRAYRNFRKRNPHR
jgi:AraC-like DNA-binding protein